MPHLEAGNNFLFGKPKSDQLFCQQSSIFDPQEFERNSPYSLKILSKEDALAQIIKQYGTREYPQFDYIDGSLGLSVTHQQLAAKIYHAPSYKLYPELYGINQAQIKAIDDYGQVLIFRADTKQLWRSSQLRPNQMRRYLKTGAIGKQGSVCPPGTTPPPKTT